MSTIGYRKAALDRLASPEQIDELMKMTTAKDWVPLLATVLVLSTVGVWAFSGSLPTKAAGQGVIVRTGGVFSVATLHGGMITALHVKVGDSVKANQVVARVAQPALVESIRALQEEIQQSRRDRDWALNLAKDDMRLRVDAIQLQRANAAREIDELRAQAELAAQQIPVQDRLLERGLVTKQQAISARQKLTALHDQVAARQAQIKQLDAQRNSAEAKPQQDDAERGVRIRQLEMKLADQQKQLSISENVVSPYSGQVIEMKVDAGSVVQAETALLSIQPEVKDLEVLVCVPSRFAKNVSPGMEAEVSPSPVRVEEFGYIRGKVQYVADYPATTQSLMRTFHNDGLVQTLTSSGPVTEIRIALERDEKAVSGFQWSSSRGPELAISSGTLASVNIITKRQPPISLLFPYIRKNLGVL